MTVSCPLQNGVLFANPARPLPQEMLAEIFLHCVHYDQVSDCIPCPTSPPLTLTWVCQSWRRLATTMPSLWTTIALGEKGTDPAYDVRLLDLWLERAGPENKLQISVCHEMKDAERPVFFDPSRGERYLEGMKVLTGKLISVSQRWQTLDLHALDLYVLDPILRFLVSTGAPHLESLSISTKYFDFFGSVHFIDLSNLPSLRTLRILCPMLCPTSNSNQAMNMKNLEIRFCPLMRDCLTWLTMCPNLERLNVRFFRATSSSLHWDKGPLTLRRLTHITMCSFSGDSDPNALLCLLVLPSLREFSLDMNRLVYPDASRAWGDRMTDIIGRTGKTLERLALVGTSMSCDSMVELLNRMAVLRELILSGPVVSDKLLESMAINMKSVAVFDGAESTLLKEKMTFSLCPRLESLELREFECSQEALVSFIYSRCRAGTVSKYEEPHSTFGEEASTGTSRVVKKVTLIWSPHPALRDPPLVQQCITSGLELVNRAYNTRILP